MKAVTILIPILFVFGCKGVYDPGEVEPGEPITISYGEEVVLSEAELILKFQDVLGDSRCPSGPFVLCVWAGNAEISLKVNKQTISLNSFSEPRTQAAYGYLFTLENVVPYPTEPQESDIEKDDYVITLSVERN